MPARFSAVAALAALALVWGYAWVTVKIATAYCGPFAFAASRTVVAVIALFVALLVLRRPLAPTPLGPTLVLGALQTTLFMTLQVVAVALGGAGKTAVLAYTMPFWTLLFAWPILGERVSGLAWLAVVLSAAGLGFVLVPFDLHAGLLPKLLALVGVADVLGRFADDRGRATRAGAPGRAHARVHCGVRV